MARNTSVHDNEQLLICNYHSISYKLFQLLGLKIKLIKQFVKQAYYLSWPYNNAWLF